MQPEPAGWDIVSGVGPTALGAAAMRALEGHHAEPLVRDPYAAAFVTAAAGQLPGPVPVTPEEAAADPDFPWPCVAHYVAVRSRFFDDFLAAAAGAGLRQAVILAAGLDTRAFRLDWTPGATVYEIDAPMVLAFKDFPGRSARVADLRSTLSRCFLLIIFLMPELLSMAGSGMCTGRAAMPKSRAGSCRCWMSGRISTLASGRWELSRACRS